MRRTQLLSVALTACVAASIHAQNPRLEPGLISIAGRVVADATGEPIRNVRVTIVPATPASPVVLTGDDGLFRLAAPVGTHGITATKTGYAPVVAAAAGSASTVIRLKKGAAIAGRVVDERGDPVEGVKVSALKAGDAKTTAAAVAETDDRGEYRLAGLGDDAFVVSVATFAAIGRQQSAKIPDPRATYFPGTASTAEAQTIRLEPGIERLGTDIVIASDNLSGLANGLFNTRFLPRAPSPRLVEFGLVKADVRPTGSVRGRVLDVRAVPLARVQVYLFTGENADSRRVVTDEEGRFAVERIVAGPLLVSVVKPGYAQVESGRTLPLFPMGRAVTSPSPADPRFGRRVELAADESQSVDLQMARWGTVSGTVTDEYGEPMQGVQVEVLRAHYQEGRRRLVSAGEPRVTDDRGRYRLYGVTPGQYVISAAVGQVSSDDLPGYTRSYYPGTPNTADARYVSVGLAEDVDFVDISMARTRTARVSGVVLDPSGEPTMPGRLTLAPSQRSSSITSVPVGAQVAADGTFVFRNVTPGEYVIQASRGRPNAHTEGVFGTALVSIDTADVAGVVVRASVGSSIAGRIRFDLDDQTKAPNPSAFELTAVPVDFDASPPATITASAEIRRDWTFEIAGLNGPRRLQLTRAPAGFALQEIRVKDVDATDRVIPLGTRGQSLANVEVVVTNRAPALNGSVLDDRGRPIAGAVVVVFSTDRQRWYPASRYMRRVVTSQDGTFNATGLPTGTYFASVTVLPGDDDDAWQDPQVLESLVPGSPTVGLSPPRATVTLRVRAR